MQPDTIDVTNIVSPTLLWTVAAMLGLGIFGLLLSWWVRRWSKQPETMPPGGFTLGALRKLRQEGKISEEEYKRTSEKLAKVQKDKLLAPKAAAEKKPLVDPKLPRE